MSKWIDLFPPRNGVAQVFQGYENIPEFKSILLQKIYIELSQIVITWTFPLPEIDLPQKWKARRYDGIHIGITFSNIQCYHIIRENCILDNKYPVYESFDAIFTHENNIFHFEALGNCNTKISCKSQYINVGAAPFKLKAY